jgi:hypothetical protein
MPWVRYQRCCKTPSVLKAEGVFFALNSKIGFIPQRAYFRSASIQKPLLRSAEPTGPASKGSLLSRSTDRFPAGSLFKSSTKSSGPTVWRCHAPDGAWRLKKEEL